MIDLTHLELVPIVFVIAIFGLLTIAMASSFIIDNVLSDDTVERLLQMLNKDSKSDC